MCAVYLFVFFSLYSSSWGIFRNVLEVPTSNREQVEAFCFCPCILEECFAPPPGSLPGGLSPCLSETFVPDVWGACYPHVTEKVLLLRKITLASPKLDISVSRQQFLSCVFCFLCVSQLFVPVSQKTFHVSRKKIFTCLAKRLVSRKQSVCLGKIPSVSDN